MLLLLDSFFVGRMTFESTGQGKFAELVTNHVFGNLHRNMLLAVVHRNGQTNENQAKWWNDATKF